MKFKISYKIKDKNNIEQIEQAKNAFAISFFEQIKNNLNFEYNISEIEETNEKEEKIKSSIITVAADFINFKEVIKPEKAPKLVKEKIEIKTKTPKEKIEGGV